MLSSVDLPQPEGPMMATNSPSFTSKLTPFKAVVSTASVRKIFVNSSILIIVFYLIYIVHSFFVYPL